MLWALLAPILSLQEGCVCPMYRGQLQMEQWLPQQWGLQGSGPGDGLTSHSVADTRALPEPAWLLCSSPEGWAQLRDTGLTHERFIYCISLPALHLHYCTSCTELQHKSGKHTMSDVELVYKSIGFPGSQSAMLVYTNEAFSLDF